MTNFEAELDAIGRWIKGAANLNSIRLQLAPPAVARPVILWEPAARSTSRNLSRYLYVTKVQQYGKLYVVSLDQLNEYENLLLADLEERVGLVPVFAGAQTIGHLEAVEIEFSNSETLDVPFTVRYEVTYSRVTPEAAPPATYVGNKITTRNE